MEILWFNIEHMLNHNNSMLLSTYTILHTINSLPGEAKGIQHNLFDEPQRELLGQCTDRALNYERAHGLHHETREEMKTMALEYIEIFCNRKYQHSTLSDRPPIHFLDAWLMTQQKKKLPA